MSGSMSPVWMPTIEGMNTYIEGLKKDASESGGKTFLSLMAFDTVFERWTVGLPIEQIKPIGTQQYHPRGMTALFDAIGTSIADADEWLGKQGAEDTRVLHVVLTDGLENSSKEYGPPDGATRIGELIKRYEATEKWTFVYLSAGQADVASTKEYAAKFAYPEGNIVAWNATSGGTNSTFANLRSATWNYSSNVPVASTSTFFEDAGQTAEDYKADRIVPPPEEESEK